MSLDVVVGERQSIQDARWAQVWIALDQGLYRGAATVPEPQAPNGNTRSNHVGATAEDREVAAHVGMRDANTRERRIEHSEKTVAEVCPGVTKPARAWSARVDVLGNRGNDRITDTERCAQVVRPLAQSTGALTTA